MKTSYKQNKNIDCYVLKRIKQIKKKNKEKEKTNKQTNKNYLGIR